MNKMKHLLWIVVAGLLSIGLLNSGAWAAEEVIIGFTGPLSGPAAQYGKDNVAGLEMAIADINEAGGIQVDGTTYKFKLKTYDDHIDPTAAVNNARRLQARDGAKVIYNPVFNTLAPLMEINDQRGSEFLLMAYTSTPAIDKIDNDLTISIPPPFLAYVRAFADIAWDKGWRKGAMVVTLGAYGDEWREIFSEYWKEKGGEITADKPANYYTETDFSAQLTSALATDPDFLLIGGPSDPTALVIEQARNMGFDGGFIMVDQAKMDYIANVAFGGDLSLMHNLIGVARTLDIGPTSVMEPFHERYVKEYGGEDTSENVLNYASMRMLAAAMEKAGTVEDPEAIKAAFSEILPMAPEKNLVAYMGIRGTRMLVPGTVQVIENGQYQKPVQNIWWPKNKGQYKKVLEQIPEREVTSKYLPLEDYMK
ncbi:MAG: ABC transporter substrate-binding protein [Desulfobacteraceae bacterium]|nr:ABC transporter substrate-binding protein [Desulfobacteraceae bacterium]